MLEAFRSMTKHNIGALVVVDKDGHTAAMFTERDLLKKVVAEDLSLSALVSSHDQECGGWFSTRGDSFHSGFPYMSITSLRPIVRGAL